MDMHQIEETFQEIKGAIVSMGSSVELCGQGEGVGKGLADLTS